mgnify:CR=1 FL=1
MVDKPDNLLMIARDNKFEINLYSEVRAYVKKQNPKNKIFIVHRLDKETRGLVICAKSEKVKNILQENWAKVIRKYYAIVLGHPVKKKARLKNYLKENRALYVYVSNFGKEAITDYEVIRETSKYALLDIDIKTGRKNQIRVQLSHINNPILGDKKYGKKFGNTLYLQAYYLKFEHPINNRELELKINLDTSFEKVLNGSCQ